MSEIVIECHMGNNGSPVFNPLERSLRGHWSNTKIPGQEMRPALRNMPDVPGINIAIDPELRTCRVFDPLETDKSTWERIDSIITANQQHFDGRMKPWDEVKQENIDDDTLKTWLWWMARLVESKKARAVLGELPSKEDILAMPGEARVQQFNSHYQNDEFTASRDTTFGKRHTEAVAKGRRQPTKGRQAVVAGSGGGGGGKSGDESK